MSAVSNFLLRRNADRPGDDLIIRPVRRDEIDRAVHLILSGSPGGRHDAGVVEFLQVALLRGLDLTGIWVAADPRRDDQLVWAVLPMMLAGKAMVMMVPPRLRPMLTSRHVSELVASALLDATNAHRVTMAQILLDPEHRAVHRALLDAGFEDVAELVYLRRQVRQPIAGRLIGDGYRLWRYDRTTHYRFGQCIARTYEGSLDCPRLNGRREMEDIIAGHKAAGEFDPNLWMLLSDIDNRDLGVLLLNRLHNHEGYELTYVGLTPDGRGQGLADALIRTAINELAREGGGSLVTACDVANAPARRMYSRHGFAHQYLRRALVKDLRPTVPTGERPLIAELGDSTSLASTTQRHPEGA